MIDRQNKDFCVVRILLRESKFFGVELNLQTVLSQRPFLLKEGAQLRTKSQVNVAKTTWHFKDNPHCIPT